MAIIPDAYDAYNEILGARTETLGKYAVPIFARNEKDRPDCVGSGTLIACGGQRFILTAAHVYQMAHLQKRQPLYIPGPVLTQLDPGTQVFNIGQGIQANQYDLCLIAVDEAIAMNLARMDKTFFDYTPSLQRGQRFEAANFMVCVLGYPTSKQKAYKTGDDTGRYKMLSYSYRDKVLPDEGFSAALVHNPKLVQGSVNAGTHYLIHFKPGGVYSTANSAAPRIFPSYHGMSGSGLWTLSHISIEAMMGGDWQPELIGVFHSGIKQPDATMLLLFTNNIIINDMLGQVLSRVPTG